MKILRGCRKESVVKFDVELGRFQREGNFRHGGAVSGVAPAKSRQNRGGILSHEA